MRRNFAQVLREGKVDIHREYSKLYSLFYGKDNRDEKSIADIISSNFQLIPFRGTCIDLEDFDETHGLNFVEQPRDFNVDYLIDFCEYIYNFVLCLEPHYFFHSFSQSDFLDQILRVIEAVGYMSVCEDGCTIFVPKNSAAIAVSESSFVPEHVSYKIISYDHHSMKGQLEDKKSTLLRFASILEGKRSDLKSINKNLESDLFYLFNNLNIRHNNVNSNDSKYKAYVAKMSCNELEHWYDETYQMCLLAILELEHKERKADLDELKSRIESAQK